MKIRTIIFFNLFFILFSVDSICLADSNGGGGRIRTVITPYNNEFKGNPKNIQKVRSKSSLKRVAVMPNNSECKYLFFYFGRSEDENLNQRICKNSPLFFIEGYNQNENEFERILLGDMKSFKILEKIGECEAKVQITVFPAISPEEIVQEKPNYAELNDKYELHKILLVKTCIPNDRLKKLRVSCSEIYNPDFDILFNDFYNNISLRFDENDSNAPIWWAIDSVIKDLDYPYDEEGEFSGGNLSSPMN